MRQRAPFGVPLEERCGICLERRAGLPEQAEPTARKRALSVRPQGQRDARSRSLHSVANRAANATELAAEMRSDHAFHKGKGWGGLAYEAMVAADGTIGFGNP